MDKKQAALEFLTKHSLGALSTVSPDGKPRSRTVYFVSDDSFSVYFLTLSGTRKVEDLEHNAHAAFVVSSEDAPKTLQIEGTIENITETEVISPLTSALIAKTQERGPFFAPLVHLDSGKALLYRLTPTWVRFGDFTDGMGSEASFTEIPL
jgi:uncharacterized pyridoxamine 5'-phosphate oxidase family protein